MTTLYQAITLRLWQKDILRLRSPEEINENLAFLGLYNGIIEFNANDRNMIYKSLKPAPDLMLKKISFLHTSDTTAMDQDQSYHFLHLTFQEFFAARYFVKHWMGDEQLFCVKLRRKTSDPSVMTPQAFLQKEKYNSRYDILWRFTTGLLQGIVGDEKENEEPLKYYFQEVEAEPRDLLGPAHQRLLMHCLSEVTTDTECGLSLRIRMKQLTLQWLRFECHFHDTMRLGRERECPEAPLKELVQRGSRREKFAAFALVNHSISSQAILEALVLLLKNGNGGSRYNAAQALSRQSNLPQPVFEAIASLFSDNNSDIRSAAVEALLRQSTLPQDILKGLTLLLRDNNPDVRLRATMALKCQSNLPQETLKALTLALKDNDRRVRVAAGKALHHQSALPRPISEALDSLLKDNNPDIRSSAIFALRDQPTISQANFETLVLLLRDDDEKLRFRAIDALSTQSDLPQHVLETFVSLLKDSDSWVNAAAVEALGRQPTLSQTVIETFPSLLKDDSESVRSCAAQALGRQPTLSQAVIEALALLLKDNSNDVRRSAAYALSCQSALSKNTLEALISLLKDNRSDVRAGAAYTLGRQSSIPLTALKALITLFKDIFKDLVSLLNDADLNGRSGAERVLRNHSEFYFTLPNLNGKYWKSLYDLWLRRSFEEQVSCCLRGPLH
ncbi:armadillo-type protein [Xylogone sp. PMI_703]|nr:armadillo-type protein [Xylogone sp. PMI_703]